MLCCFLSLPHACPVNQGKLIPPVKKGWGVSLKASASITKLFETIPVVFISSHAGTIEIAYPVTGPQTEMSSRICRACGDTNAGEIVCDRLALLLLLFPVCGVRSVHALVDKSTMGAAKVLDVSSAQATMSLSIFCATFPFQRRTCFFDV